MNSLLSSLLGPTRGRAVASPRPAVHLDEIGALPAAIAAGPDAPGAPLHDVLAVVQERVPGATGLIVRDGRLFVAYGEPPDDASRAASREVLGDEAAIAGLAADSVARAAGSAENASADLRTQLLDASLPDDAWLRAFRRYQVALLSGVGPGPERPDDPRPVRRGGGSE